jgi:NADH:ubiquinone oxidoreductase subunit 2 (subunit N)
LWLVAAGALATVASAAAFARIVLACFAPPRLDAVAPQRARTGTVVLVVLALAIVVVGVVPGPLLDAAQAVRF